MAPKIKDPLADAKAALVEERKGEPGAAQLGVPATFQKKARRQAKGSVKAHTQAEARRIASEAPSASMQAVLDDFRLFLVLLWRHLLGCDPNPAQLDLAWYLQYGPERSVILAFRGFSKSWITGAYALWRLLRDPEEKILVVSGSLTRAVATTNWCLQLILTWPLLASLKPRPDQRQSSKAFDVGPALPAQSPSFHALGIGGQIVGFRGTCIIPDDVETQTNSRTVGGRQIVWEAVKEFDSVLVPGGVIKYLGTPHDEDSLYNELDKRGYDSRIWPALFPNAEQIKKYGKKLAPWISSQLAKDPSLVGRSIMPLRFSDEDLAKRKMSLGTSEFALQFLLDTSLSDRDKYPLKYKDLMVTSLDPQRGPETLVWSEDPKQRITDIQRMGFDGDYIHAAIVPPDTTYAPYNRIVAAVDNSGRGSDETALVILAELHGRVFLLHLWADTAGYDIATLSHIAAACVRFKVQKIRLESNFGDGMFAALLRPVLEAAWKKHLKGRNEIDGPSGTEIEEMRASNQMAKERRILSVLEPVVQSHRLVVDRSVMEWDYESILKKEGEDGRHRYSLFHQFTHLTRDKDCLVHDDRLDALALGVADFADILGVDPGTVAAQSAEERMDEELAKLFGEMEEDDEGILRPVNSSTQRAGHFLPTRR